MELADVDKICMWSTQHYPVLKSALTFIVC